MGSAEVEGHDITSAVDECPELKILYVGNDCEDTGRGRGGNGVGDCPECPELENAHVSEGDEASGAGEESLLGGGLAESA